MFHDEKKLSDIMTPNPEVVRPDSTLDEVARRMKDLDVGSMLVCDGKRLLGLVTDRDITIRAVAEGRDPKMTRANETMTPGIVYCYEDQTVGDAQDLMAEKQIRRLPILDRNKMLVGIVSLGDLAIEDDQEKRTGKTLEDISKPSKPDR